MGYRIDYEGGTVTKRTVHLSTEKKKVAIVLLVVALFLGMMAWPKGRGVLRDILIPGDDAVTSAAWDGLVEDLKEGHTFGTAVEVFCREIIYAG